jgi:N-acetylglucosamine-6-phosphate deacetylase
MFDSTVILNARLPNHHLSDHRADYRTLYQIAIAHEKIQSVEPMQEVNEAIPLEGVAIAEDVILSDATVIDVAGDWVSLGAVDLQINGALGLAFPDLREKHFEQLQNICELLWQQGVDGFCPTLVTTSLENFHGSLAAIQTFQAQQAAFSGKPAATILGAHLEGPFLNADKRGAHPEEFLQPLTLENIKRVIGDFAETVRIVTLAPEIEAGEGIIEWLTQQGITVSLGHSLATAAQANRAFDQGATMVTHAFNAMPGLHHREPGLLGAALADSRVFCGFIADGQHICPTMLNLLMRMGRGSIDTALGGLFLVSDALSPLGLPDGLYPWDTRQIEVINGTARLADGTLSGTTLPLIEGAMNLVNWEIACEGEAIALVTDAPRRAIGLPGLAPGSPAHLLRWRQDTTQQLIWQRL